MSMMDMVLLFFSVAVGIIAICTVVFKVARWTGDVNHDRKAFRELMERVLGELKEISDGIRGVRDDIKGVRDDIKGVRDDIKVVSDEVKGVRDDIKEVNGGVKEILMRLPSESSGHSSPLRLTGQGRSMSRDLKARDWAETKTAEFADRLRGKQPFEVHEFSLKYVREEFRPDAEWDARIGACAYENGMTRDKVLDVLALELRDALLELLAKGDSASRENASVR